MAETIFAVASGAGRSAIAIIRISGAAVARAIESVAGSLPPPRHARLRTIRSPDSGAPLDRALVIWFPGPASATGEDVAEIHLHGSRAVVAAVLEALGRLPGCRLAEPGEFTRRAFLNGRMDLAEVEGLADLIDADTEAQRRQALRQMGGALSAWTALQRERLVTAMAAAESAIDFSDEADVSGDFIHEMMGQVFALREAVREQLSGSAAATRVREGYVVALSGPPNAGKSTLLNALARRDVVIVSPLPGTTRDAIEVSLDFGGFLVQAIDTAGIRASDDPIEREGIARALQRARGADLILWLSDVQDPHPPSASLGTVPVWRVGTKIDADPRADRSAFDVAIAAETGEGLSTLVERITALITMSSSADQSLATRERHRAALQRADEALTAIVDAGSRIGMELAAEQLRAVAQQLDTLIGRVTNDEVLGAIFARFCVGK